MSEWIDTNDREPDQEQVLFTDGKIVEKGSLYWGRWYVYSETCSCGMGGNTYSKTQITHWMPLPFLPEEQKNE